MAPFVPSLAAHRRANTGNPERPPGIEGVEMINAYYNLMRKPANALPVCISCVLTVSLLAAPQQPALKTASLESHEGLTISAQPWTDAARYKEKFPKKSPLAAGVLAVQVVFRNDSNESVKVNLDRIRLTVQLDADNRQEVQPLTADQLADAVLKPAAKDPTKRSRLPLPLPSSQGGKDKHWTELQKQALEAAVPSGVVAAHGNVQGLLYFDLQSQFDLLQTAHLYIPEVMQMQQGTALTYFDIDLSRRGPQ
jgi:hypothetical protein